MAAGLADARLGYRFSAPNAPRRCTKSRTRVLKVPVTAGGVVSEAFSWAGTRLYSQSTTFHAGQIPYGSRIGTQQIHNPTSRCSWRCAAARWRGHKVVYRAGETGDRIAVANSQVNVGGKFPLPVCVNGIVGVLLDVHADRRPIIRCGDTASRDRSRPRISSIIMQ